MARDRAPVAIAVGAMTGATCATLSLWMFSTLSGHAFDLANAAAVWLFALVLLLIYWLTIGMALHGFLARLDLTGPLFYVAPAGACGFLAGAALARFFEMWAADDGAPRVTSLDSASLITLSGGTAALAALAAWLVLRTGTTNPVKPAP